MAKVWDANTGLSSPASPDTPTGVQDLAFSPDGQTIASVGGAYHGPDAAEVKLWDWRTGDRVARLVGHTGLVTAVAYFPDGRRLATASDDRTIKLWDTMTREDVLTLRGHTSGVLSLAISRDGRQIASGSIDYSAKIWSTAPRPARPPSFRCAAPPSSECSRFSARHLLKSEVLEAAGRQEPEPAVAGDRAGNRRASHRECLADFTRPPGSPTVRPGRPADDYRLAVRRLEAACQVVDRRPRTARRIPPGPRPGVYRAGQPGARSKRSAS